MTKTEHLLTCLIEECAEVQKEATKALRFGLDDKWGGEKTTVEKLSHEMYDLLAVYEMLVTGRVIPAISSQEVAEKIVAKHKRVLKYMDYARERGTIIE
jgi:NTP pyrophosphatase (non-canonical NTP hydrolase)